jgi:hypothetical protein
LSHDATASHFAQAKRELTGVPDTDPKDAILESAPESERWDPLPGSTGTKARVAPSEDEDEEGRSDNERLSKAASPKPRLSKVSKPPRRPPKRIYESTGSHRLASG